MMVGRRSFHFGFRPIFFRGNFRGVKPPVFGDSILVFKSLDSFCPVFVACQGASGWYSAMEQWPDIKKKLGGDLQLLFHLRSRLTGS